jgi:hypothetical protein
MQLDEGELARAVASHEHVELALLGPDLSQVDVELADRIPLEGLLGRLFGLDAWLAGDVVALEQPVERRACQMRNRRLQSVEAVV